MTLNNTLPPTHPRKRRTALGLVFASVILGSTLSACSSNPGDTTCGEVTDMSVDERVDLLQDGIDEDGDEEDQKAFDDASDEEKEAGAAVLLSACEGEDDDTKLNDIDGFS